MRNSGISIIKSVANLKISYHFSLEKILRSTHTLDCDKYRLKLKGEFFSFCWAIFLYFSTPISWVMSYDKKCPRFVDPVRGWVKIYNLDRTKSSFLATRLYKKIIFTKNWGLNTPPTICTYAHSLLFTSQMPMDVHKKCVKYFSAHGLVT